MMFAKERISFTIPAALYDKFAWYAASKRLPLSALFRQALSEFAEVSLSDDPVADAEYEALLAQDEDPKTKLVN